MASLAMVFINKGVLMRYPHSMTLLTLQMMFTAGILYASGALGAIKIRPFQARTARALLPLSFFYNANVAFSLASLRGVNIPMYIALKRLTPMATAYLVLVEISGAEGGLSSFELMLYNSVLSLPVLSGLVYLTGEAAESLPLLLAQCTASLGFAFAIGVSLVMGIVLNYTMFLCTIVNSALTTTIVGVLKGTLGFFILGGVEVRAMNVLGLVINSCGGVWYSIAKYRQKKTTPKKETENEPLLPTSISPKPVVGNLTSAS
eukprot:jgi/Mesen1/10670/ME000009S10461